MSAIALVADPLGFWPAAPYNFSTSDPTQPLPAIVAKRYNDNEADLIVWDSAGTSHYVTDMLIYPVSAGAAAIAQAPCGQWQRET